MAPMFLVSDARMMIAGLQAGIAVAVPALNYRTDEDFRVALDQVRAAVSGPIGINLIVNKSNIHLKQQLQTCVEKRVDFIITSLGSPEEVIRTCKPHGIKVLCDVVDGKYARKVEELGADAVIAVNNQAGGHAGPTNPVTLVKELKSVVKIPVVSAGGVAFRRQMDTLIEAGADGFSVGTVFIASEEAPVSREYKEACIQYKAADVVFTTKLSGTPCTVIKTPYVEKIGTKQNALERFLNRNKQIKKWVKAFTFLKGMKALRKAAFSATYKTLWCAGPAIEHIHEIRPIAAIVKDLVTEDV